LGKTYTVSA